MNELNDAKRDVLYYLMAKRMAEITGEGDPEELAQKYEDAATRYKRLKNDGS